jgi:hypothetical protein
MDKVEPSAIGVVNLNDSQRIFRTTIFSIRATHLKLVPKILRHADFLNRIMAQAC